MKYNLPRNALLCFTAVFCILASLAAEVPDSSPVTRLTLLDWNSDYPRALALAKREHKLLLLDFTGSDWCVWCQRLHEEVFAEQFFAVYAKANLVLVELDFPRKKILPKALKEQNGELAERFLVNSYPTIVVLDQEGKELGRTRYMEGGAKTFVRELKRIAKKATAKTDS